jgi:hypothetical protein
MITRGQPLNIRNNAGNQSMIEPVSRPSLMMPLQQQ